MKHLINCQLLNNVEVAFHRSVMLHGTVFISIFLKMKTTVVILFFSFGILNQCDAQKDTIDPERFIATITFDEGVPIVSNVEPNFPNSYRFNTTQDGNGDGVVDTDDALENHVKYAIGDSVFGVGRTGLSNRGPNDQRPAVYFHYYKEVNYEVYEYWLYYADNDFWNKHEHDWEKYFVYVQNDQIVSLRISSHGDFDEYSYCDISLDDGHPIIDVEGDSHSMSASPRGGVKIRYNGEISENDGRLDYGDGLTIPWVIYTNDSDVYVIGGVPFDQTPDKFNYGDPEYPILPPLGTGGDEYGESSNSPWKRSDWDSPSGANIVYLGSDIDVCSPNPVTLSTGNNHDSYLWSTGETAHSIDVDSSGVYSVIATDPHGCSSYDTILVQLNDTLPESNFDYSTNQNTVQFADSSINASSLIWQFGDGTLDTVSNGDVIHVYADTGTYNVCLYATNDCGSVQYCEEITITQVGVEERIANDIQLFPNPTTDIIQIEGRFQNVFVFSLLGDKLSSYSKGEVIDISNLPIGIYILRIDDIERKIVKL